MTRAYIYEHAGAKIWILSSSGENNILRMSEANEFIIQILTNLIIDSS